MNYKKLVFLIGIVFILTSVASAQDFEYIGALKCKICHNKPDKGAQYKLWLEGPHANAMKSLSDEEAKDPKCIKCHSTVGHADPDLVATLKITEGVSCESCHGPGSMYKSNSVMKNKELSLSKGMIEPTEMVCKKCHNEESPHYKGFNYEEYAAKIAHPNPLK